MTYHHDTKDPNLNDLHKAMEYNSRGQPIIRTSGGSGNVDLTSLSVVTDTALDGGSLTYDGATGANTSAGTWA